MIAAASLVKTFAAEMSRRGWTVATDGGRVRFARASERFAPAALELAAVLRAVVAADGAARARHAGRSTSAAKAAASRENGKKGGRPRKNKEILKC